MNGPSVHRTVRRVEAELVAELGDHGVATVHEAYGKTGLMAPCIRPLFAGSTLAGPAVTALVHPGDNLMLHAAVAVAQPGDVLVVATSSLTTDGMFGELLATSARARGVVGLVIDAGVRDIAALRSAGFPVWSRSISAQGTAKARAGSVNIPVVCAGARVCPGDAIVADDDGVVCVAQEQVPAVLERARRRVEHEAQTRARLAAGELGMDIYGLWEVVRGQGVSIEEPK